MNYSNKQQREMVRDDYDAIASVYVNTYGNFD